MQHIVMLYGWRGGEGKSLQRSDVLNLYILRKQLEIICNWAKKIGRW